MDFDPQGAPAPTLQPLSRFSAAARARVRGILFDIDDTLTTEGKLTATAYAATERLHEAGLLVVPITGRPAGWCDHFARMWPVDAVVGENGAFYFSYDDDTRTMTRRYWKDDGERALDRRKLERLGADILAAVPGCAVSADQPYREADLAIDFREDVTPLDDAVVAKIKKLFEDGGARAKISSIHVNGWFGDYDKLAMTHQLFREVFHVALDAVRESVVFAGDSPNDAPMFAYFPYAVGVANVADFAGRLDAEPAWITSARGGHGFAELAEAILDSRGS